MITYIIILLVATYIGSVALSLATQRHDGAPSFIDTITEAFITTVGVVVTLGIGYVIFSGMFALLS